MSCELDGLALLGVVLGCVVMVGACTWETELPADAKAIQVNAERELLITDESPALTTLSSNAGGGMLSFSRAMTRDGNGSGVLRWLDAWSARLRDEGESARADDFERRVTCAWLRVASANQCDEQCRACRTRVLRMSAAPFRLIAVANRTDLSVMPDGKATGGEARLVYALTDGAADALASAPLRMTVIIEYAQAGAADDWAARWHALGSLSEDQFVDGLSDTLRPLVEQGAIAQIRTADALTGPLVMHQFELADQSALVAKNVRNTPDWSKVTKPELEQFAADNEAAIANGTFVMPRSWWASSATMVAPPDWVASVNDHDAITRQTCGGCHALADGGFQIDPLASGRVRRSRFLSDPSAETDELRRRTEWMQLSLLRGSHR